MSRRTIAVDAWEALFRAQVTVMRQLQREFPGGEITLSEYDVLFNLARQEDQRLRIRDLGDHMLLTQPSVSRMVDRLTARGLVEKHPDPSDRRGIIVALTGTGAAAFGRAARPHMDSINARVGGVLTDNELEQLHRLCTKLRLGVPSAQPKRR